MENWFSNALRETCFAITDRIAACCINEKNAHRGQKTSQVKWDMRVDGGGGLALKMQSHTTNQYPINMHTAPDKCSNCSATKNAVVPASAAIQFESENEKQADTMRPVMCRSPHWPPRFAIYIFYTAPPSAICWAWCSKGFFTSWHFDFVWADSKNSSNSNNLYMKGTLD